MIAVYLVEDCLVATSSIVENVFFFPCWPHCPKPMLLNLLLAIGRQLMRPQTLLFMATMIMICSF